MRLCELNTPPPPIVFYVLEDQVNFHLAMNVWRKLRLFPLGPGGRSLSFLFEQFRRS